MPKVSVIIPCYTQAIYLDDAIESILSQTFQDFEIIVVDDGSDDETSIKILDNYENPRTKLIRTPNQGPALARNCGIENATGEYIIPLDADDIIGDRYLEKAVNILDKCPNIGIVYCEAELFGERSGKWDLPEYTFPRILLHNCIFCTAMFRKSDWENVGGYNREMEYSSEDWEFWLSLIESGLEVYRIPETLFYYRVQKISRTSESLVHHELEMRLKLLKLHKNMYESNLDFIIESYYGLQTEISGLNQELAQKNRIIRNLNQITSSRSWKLTEPLRKMGFLLRKFKKIYTSTKSSLKNSNFFFHVNNLDVQISIIMANYNYAHFLPRAINSVVSQSYHNWELIIVDDGSTDESVSVINDFIKHNPKIKLYQHDNKVNKGLKDTLKLGLEHSNGDFIAFLESDDWWEDNYLESKIKIIKKYPEVKFVFNDVDMFSDSDTDLTWFYNYFKWQKEILSNVKMPSCFSKYFAEKNFIPTFSCVLVCKELLLGSNFDTPIDSLIDFWLWTQISMKTEFFYINKKLTHWYRHDNSYIKASSQEREEKLDFYNYLRRKFLLDLKVK
jgi:glycosyltransferase involved in cell wall biosynthesis